VHGYLIAVRYPNQIAANSLTAAKADLISQITIELMPPPSAIALISLVAVCLVPCRTKAGSRLVSSGAVLLWLTVGYACHSKHVTAYSGNSDRNPEEYIALNLKKVLEKITSTVWIMQISACRSIIVVFGCPSFTRSIGLTISGSHSLQCQFYNWGFKCLASENWASKHYCSGLDMAQLIEIKQF